MEDEDKEPMVLTVEIEGEEQEIELPMRYIVCTQCRGMGKSSLYLGAITEEDRRRDWSDDEFDSYRNGGYDRKCDACNGERVQYVVNEEAIIDKDILKAYKKHLREEREYESMCRMERLSGC